MEFKLVVIGGKKAGMEIPISMRQCVIGRGDDCHIRPQSPLVSRRHCVISVSHSSAAIEDCGSANGTLVNGEKVHHQRELENNDRIRVGTLELEVRLTGAQVTVRVTQANTPFSHDAGTQVQRKAAETVTAETVIAKSLTSQPTENRPNASRTVASAAIHAREASLLGWCDGKSNGHGKDAVLPITKTLDSQGISPGKLAAAGPLKPASQGQQTVSRQVVFRQRAGGLPAAGACPQPFPRNGKAEQLLVGCEEASALSLNQRGNVAEWKGADLLLLAALGLALVVVLSWLFPLSWPEAGQGPHRWLRWSLQNWWHIWWMRWGAVTILVSVLLKLLCLRARSERRVRT